MCLHMLCHSEKPGTAGTRRRTHARARTRYTDSDIAHGVNEQESINIATYLQLHMAGTSRYTYLPSYLRAEKTNTHTPCTLVSAHLLYLLVYYYEKKVLTRAHHRYRPRKGEKACRRVR